MIQFNCNRFGKLAKWSLTVDRGFYLRNLLNVFVIMSLFFIAFTTRFFHLYVNGNDSAYRPCLAAAMIMFIITGITGPSWMFSSMKGKHDLQALLMLPASNFEKFLMRYSSWMILVPLNLVAFFAADLVQYLVNVLMGHDYATFVSTTFVDMVSNIWNKMSEELRSGFVIVLTLVIVWMHSLYALGATFFRSHKYNWIPTTIIIILLVILQVVINSLMGNRSLEIQTETNKFIVNVVIVILLIVFNFWMSYRLFCRQQVIGKLVNL